MRFLLLPRDRFLLFFFFLFFFIFLFLFFFLFFFFFFFYFFFVITKAGVASCGGCVDYSFCLVLCTDILRMHIRLHV